jgi:phosphate transport system substrate-binding protein
MKNLSWCAVLATVVGIGYLGALNDGSASAETLYIQGSSGFSNEVMGPYQANIEALTGHKLSVIANTSGLGLLALLKGEADLAMISASLNDMIALLRKPRPDLPFHLLRELSVADARVAYPVNPGNPVRSVSRAKLKQILSGQIDNWRELGGPDLPIHVVSLRDGGGTKRTTEAILFGGQRIMPRFEIIVESAQEVVQTVAQDPGALGITQARLVKLHPLPELQTNGLASLRVAKGQDRTEGLGLT